MALLDSILKFLGSKWFTLILGLALILVLPFTYHNVSVVLKADQLARFWWIALVFVVNVLSVFMCAYKFMAAITKKQPVQSQEW